MTKRTILKTEILSVVQTNVRLRGLLATALEVNPATIQRWAKDNDPYLCLPDSIFTIKSFLKLSKTSEITTQVEIGDKYLTH